MIDSLFAEIFAVDGSGGGPSSFGFSAFSDFSSVEKGKNRFNLVWIHMKSFTANQFLEYANSNWLFKIRYYYVWMREKTPTRSRRDTSLCYRTQWIGFFFSFQSMFFVEYFCIAEMDMIVRTYSNRSVCLPFFSDFGVLAISSFLSSFLFGLHTMSVTIPSARFNKEAAYLYDENERT